MSLTQDLAQQRHQSRQGRPQAVLSTMDGATAALQAAGITDSALSAGDTVPSFELPNALGQSVAIRSLLAQGPVVISFYRGGWCPYCNLELRALQAALPEFQALGANLVAISPQTPDSSLSTQEKQALSYEVLSDRGNGVARQFGLVFTLPENLRTLYGSFGIDLSAANGEETYELPIPATYIVDSSGKIAYAFVEADYTQRLDPEQIIAVLKDLTHS